MITETINNFYFDITFERRVNQWSDGFVDRCASPTHRNCSLLNRSAHENIIACYSKQFFEFGNDENLRKPSHSILKHIYVLKLTRPWIIIIKVAARGRIPARNHESYPRSSTTIWVWIPYWNECMILPVIHIAWHPF